jgi:hypothetical protein
MRKENGVVSQLHVTEKCFFDKKIKYAPAQQAATAGDFFCCGY